jgi:multiple sugar transport system permease protein
LIQVVDISLRGWQLPGRPYVGPENYQRFLTDEVLWSSFRTTLAFGLASAGLSFSVGLGVALLLASERLRWRTFFRSLIFLPYLVSPIAAGVTWKLMYAPVDGIVGYLLGLRTVDWLGDVGLALPAVVAVAVWQWAPFYTVVLTAGLLSLPREPYEAAQIDGADAVRTFWHLTLPMLRPVILVAVLLNTIDVLRTFALVFALTEGGPGRITEVIGMHIYLTAFRFFRIDDAAAQAILLICITATITLALLRLGRERPRALPA